jgi:hypothetical protein
LFLLSQKSVTRVATRGPPGLLSSRVMSKFAITSHQYTITLYTAGHLQISWDVFAKKSADILSFGISFITISNLDKQKSFVPNKKCGMLVIETLRYKSISLFFY